MAANDANLPLPLSPRPWWQLFIGKGHETEISVVCNALLALQDENIVSDAFNFFLPSLLSTTKQVNVHQSDDKIRSDISQCSTNISFNDPGSYIWNLMDLEESSNK